MIGLSTEWADDNHMGDTFGITAAQSARSGYARHTAEAGFKSASAEIGFIYPFGDNWVARTMVEYTSLIGDAGDSPLVKDDNQFSVGFMIGYEF